MSLYFVIRDLDKEAVGLVHINASPEADMRFDFAREGRFGWYVPVHRSIPGGTECHVYNIMLGEHYEEMRSLVGMGHSNWSQVSESEWETYAAFDMPVLKVATADGPLSSPWRATHSKHSLKAAADRQRIMGKPRYRKRGRGW